MQAKTGGKKAPAPVSETKIAVRKTIREKSNIDKVTCAMTDRLCLHVTPVFAMVSVVLSLSLSLSLSVTNSWMQVAEAVKVAVFDALDNNGDGMLVCTDHLSTRANTKRYTDIRMW